MKHNETFKLVCISLITSIILIACFWTLVWGVGTLVDICTTDSPTTESTAVEYEEIITTEESIELPLVDTTPIEPIPEPEPTEGIPEPIIDIIETESTEVVSEPVEAVETTETIPEVREEDVELLAIVIYQEAGWDLSCDDCRRRVADIVLNRVESEYFPDTIYEVLTQKGQYGRLHWTGVVWPEMAKYDCEAEAVERAYRIAREVLEGIHSDVYGEGYIWQAEFVQGTDGFWCCGTYFGRG